MGKNTIVWLYTTLIIAKISRRILIGLYIAIEKKNPCYNERHVYVIPCLISNRQSFIFCMQPFLLSLSPSMLLRRTWNKFPQVTTMNSPLTVNVNQFCLLTFRFTLRCLILWSHPSEPNCFLIWHNSRSGITNWSVACITSSLSRFEYK